MRNREYVEAIKDEVEHWKGVTVEFVEATKGGHPKAKFQFGGKFMSHPFASTPSDSAYGKVKMLGDMRRKMKALGAVRDKPEPSAADEEKQYSKPNDGAKMRPDPVQREPIKAGVPSMPEQFKEVAKQAGLELPEPKAKAVADDDEGGKMLMPVSELRLDVGVYDISAEDYHGDPCLEPSLSSSLAKIIAQRSPGHAREEHPRLNPAYEREELMKFRVGQAFHSMLLGKGAPVAEFAHKKWQSNAAKADRDAALANGYIPLTEDQAAKTRRMVERAVQQIKGRDELAYAMSGGVPERVYIWREDTKFGPIYCRMMVDWTPHAGRYFVDWKSTGVGALHDWGSKTMWDTGCDFQDAFYRRGFKAHGMDFDACCFAVIEDSEPHGLMTHRIDPEAQDEADDEVQWAIDHFAMCLHAGHWPMYPLQMAWQQKPAWRVNQHAERKVMGQQMVNQENLAEYMQMLADTRAENDARGPVALPGTADDPFGGELLNKGTDDGI